MDVFAIQDSGRTRRVYVPSVIAPAGRFGVNGFVDDVGNGCPGGGCAVGAKQAAVEEMLLYPVGKIQAELSTVP